MQHFALYNFFLHSTILFSSITNRFQGLRVTSQTKMDQYVDLGQEALKFSNEMKIQELQLKFTDGWFKRITSSFY